MESARLLVLGPPELWLGPVRVPLRSQKTFLLLAYLALEGPTPRERLADLLWESEKGLGNLRVELYRLDQRAPGVVLRSERTLGVQGVRVDAERFEALVEEGRLEAALEFYRGPFLEGLKGRLTADLEEWVGHRRERYREAYLKALRELAERASDPAVARRHLSALLAEDPLDEAALRALMRSHAELGETKRALAAYRAFAAFLERELGLPPEPETRDLARRLEGKTLPKRRKEPFVGRERELFLMQEAYEEGRTVLVSGEPGIGKTRLLREFVLRLGKRPLLLRGRPGDRSVPYATLARGIRELLALGAEPPDWALRELARVVPELGKPPPASTPSRFVAAFVELLRPFLGEDWVLGVDDLQYLDSASTHFLLGAVAQLPPRPIVVAYRTGGLPRRIARWVQEELGRGRAVQIALGPLDPAAVAELLGLPAARAERLAAYAGGNPFFLLQLAEEKGKVPDRVQALIQNRLAGARPLARGLAELASVAGEAYDLELAIELLGESPLAVAEASDELERLGLFRRGRVSHDLVAEATRAGMDPETLRFWHRRLARALSGRAPPAEVAEHHRAAGETGEAARLWVEAALEAERAFAYREALGLFARALAHAPKEQKPALTLETFVPRYRTHLALADWEATGELLDEAEAFARAHGLPWLLDRTQLGRADLAFRQGRFEEAEARAAGLLAGGRLDADGRAHAQYIRAVALQALGRHRESRRCCQEALEHAPEGWEMHAWAHNTLAIAEMHLGNLERARSENEAALVAFRARGDAVGEANALRVMAELAAREGRREEAEALFEDALALVRKTGHQIVLGFVLAAAVRFFAQVGERERARALAAEGLRLGGFYRPLFEAHL